MSTAYLYNDIASTLKKTGYDVVVLSTTPHFNVVKEQLSVQPMKWGLWGLYKQSLFRGVKGELEELIRVYHVPQKNSRVHF